MRRTLAMVQRAGPLCTASIPQFCSVWRWRKGTAGATYNASAEQGIATKEIAEAIGKKLALPVGSKTVEEAVNDIGFLAGILSADNPTSSEKTQKELGWKPSQIGLLEDIEKTYSANTNSKLE